MCVDGEYVVDAEGVDPGLCGGRQAAVREREASRDLTLVGSL